MANVVPGISTLGVRVGWMTGSADTIPTSGTCNWFTRVNSTGEVALDTNTIDASALEDYVDKSIAGRASTGGTYSITVNQTPETIDEWADAMTASASNNGIWIQEWSPQMPEVSDWLFVQTPRQFPKAAKEQNSLMTAEIQCALVNFAGQAAAVDAPTS